MKTYLLNQYERQFVREYNIDVQQGRKRYKPLFMSRFEMAQAKRNFGRDIEPYLKPIVEFLNRVL
ncbi:hypothetical protein [Geofilum rhodophaeum]|uniref:hypothetical protein n=1 Tax=Geofilum rhodophaeum TaxID=1965019 RepID=UPI000B521330|nr:hypothetical protein [Geofilum rhodophaeum]